jgi:hypothetical protein
VSKLLLLTICIVALSFPSCQKKKSSPFIGKQTAHIEENPILSAEPSENVSIEDYWDEAIAIKAEAEQVIQRAGSSGCSMARKQAVLSINLAEQAENSDELLSAERLIGKANTALSQSYDALTLCEEKIDMVYPTQMTTAQPR